MEESNNFFAAAMSAIGATIAGFYAHLAPWLLLGAVLVLVDLRFGILAARSESPSASRWCRWARSS